MTSKLEKHEVFIIEKLCKGDSYSSIAGALKEIGCETSAQNLFMWIRRRPAKLKARQALAHALRPYSEPQSASTTSAAHSSQVSATELGTNKVNQNSEDLVQIKNRSAENDFLRSLSKKCAASLLPIIFHNKKL
jgi:hypothetical protein